MTKILCISLAGLLLMADKLPTILDNRGTNYEGETPKPLPNLDFKIECGSSLSVPAPQNAQQPDLIRQEQIERFDRLKADYAAPRRCAG